MLISHGMYCHIYFWCPPRASYGYMWCWFILSMLWRFSYAFSVPLGVGKLALQRQKRLHACVRCSPRFLASWVVLYLLIHCIHLGICLSICMSVSTFVHLSVSVSTFVNPLLCSYICCYIYTYLRALVSSNTHSAGYLGLSCSCGHITGRPFAYLDMQKWHAGHFSSRLAPVMGVLSDPLLEWFLLMFTQWMFFL